MAFRLVLFATTIISALAAVPFDPQGPYKTKGFADGNIIIHQKGAGMGIYTWSPEAAGEYPVVVFATGFGGDAPSLAYGNVLNQIASYGYIIVSIDQLAYPQPNKYVETITDAVNWIDANLTTLLDSHGLKHVKYDFDKAFALAAQSSGNHMVVSYLNNTCGKAKALIMIDPVDGADPFGIVKNFIITPGTPVSFKIPTLLLNNGLDPTRGLDGLGPACAPAHLSNDRFYDAWNSPIWLINATKYGHVDCLDAALADVAKFLCPGHGGVIAPYQQGLAGSSVAFLDAVFRKQTQYLDVLEDSANYLVKENVMKHDYHGMDRTVTPYCTRA